MSRAAAIDYAHGVGVGAGDTRAQLRGGRELIRQGWTQNAAASAASGREVDVNDPRACRWCAGGALQAVGADIPAFAAIKRWSGNPFISGWNDSPRRTQAEVLAVFDEAIAEQHDIAVFDSMP